VYNYHCNPFIPTSLIGKITGFKIRYKIMITYRPKYLYGLRRKFICSKLF